MKNHTPRQLARQEGSAYVITLLVLVVLALLGLALVFVTASENQIGANERLAARAFYASDSGLAIATARLIVANDASKSQVEFQDGSDSTLFDMRNRVQVEEVRPLFDAPCNLCSVNNAGTGLYNEVSHRKVAFQMGVTGERVIGNTGQTVAAKQVEAMLEMQPWPGSVDAYIQAAKNDNP